MKYRILYRVNKDNDEYALQTLEWYGWANCLIHAKSKFPAWFSNIPWYTRRSPEEFFKEAMEFMKPVSKGVVVKEGEV